ncbi:hypothetical protein [Streptomyces sp. NPDC002346]
MRGSAVVRMEYAGLPAGQTIEVADASVPAYERMGWVVVGDRPAEDKTAAAGRRWQTPKEGN